MLQGRFLCFFHKITRLARIKPKLLCIATVIKHFLFCKIYQLKAIGL